MLGGRHLDRRGQVQDDLLCRGRPPHIHYRLADFDRELELGPGEAFGRILVDDLGLRHRSASSRISRAAVTAMSTMPALSRPKTTRRCKVEVEL